MLYLKNLQRGFCILALLTAVVWGQDAVVPEAEDTSAIRIRCAPIEGKVFLLSEKENEEEAPGSNVKIQIKRPGERKILYETKTVKDGSYTLPRLEPQEYYLLIGDLRLDLEVFPEISERTDLRKILIIMIPREMAGPEAAWTAGDGSRLKPVPESVRVPPLGKSIRGQIGYLHI